MDNKSLLKRYKSTRQMREQENREKETRRAKKVQPSGQS